MKPLEQPFARILVRALQMFHGLNQHDQGELKSALDTMGVLLSKGIDSGPHYNFASNEIQRFLAIKI